MTRDGLKLHPGVFSMDWRRIWCTRTCDVEMWHLWQIWFVEEQDCNRAPRQVLITQLPPSHRSHHCSRIIGVTVTRACRVVTVTAPEPHCGRAAAAEAVKAQCFSTEAGGLMWAGVSLIYLGQIMQRGMNPSLWGAAATFRGPSKCQVQAAVQALSLLMISTLSFLLLPPGSVHASTLGGAPAPASPSERLTGNA